MGPPGTGKATTAVAIVAALAEVAVAAEGIPDAYILATASTLVAVDPLLSRLRPYLQELVGNGSVIGLGDERNTIDKVVTRLGDPRKWTRSCWTCRRTVRWGYLQRTRVRWGIRGDRNSTREYENMFLASR